ncbi:hypothetical protein GS4_40_00100 [Gordonia soli NBRC 108243]|uniref:Uncharacterized protein n=1 Tax=Gordonia soli NBRC 108243 TaxID=1223545 RepID=M0QR40_9ACTN|nr:hypothetical protein GS4_40_00100 [Gordonia soli NBRC 108243]
MVVARNLATDASIDDFVTGNAGKIVDFKDSLYLYGLYGQGMYVVELTHPNDHPGNQVGDHFYAAPSELEYID